MIVADGEDVRDLLPNDERIRLIHFDGQLEIGDKRNAGCELAHGEVIAHWDDDDVSAPERLGEQLQRLGEGGSSVTGYRTMRFTDGSQWWLYNGSPDYALGTSLVYRKDWWMNNRFLSLQIGEDNDFWARARDARKAVTADGERFMFAAIHPSNTSAKRTEGKTWVPVDSPDLRMFGVTQ